MKKALLITLILILSNILFSQEIKLELDNQYIQMGDWAQLNVTSTNINSRPNFKEVKDVELVFSGSSSSFSMVNGKTSQSTTYIYKVIPQKEGELKLPVFYSKSNKGEEVLSNEIILYVEKGNTNTQNQNITTTANLQSEYTMLFIDIPQRDLYSGEAVEVTIRGYFNQKYSHNILKTPYIEEGSFTLDLPWKYKTKEGVMINNQYWIEAKWTGYLTSIGSGINNLKIKMESVVNIPMGNSSSFFRSTREKEVETATELISIDILPLPQSGKPENFSGAIGNFSISSRVDSMEVNNGDPLTITLDIYGIGNFQRVDAPTIAETDNWKTYPPSSSYSGNNKSDYQGVKTFQQIVTPQNTKINQTPKFTFSYFDPIEKSYKILKTDQYEIKVNKGTNIITSVQQTKQVEFKDRGTIIKHNISPILTNSRIKNTNKWTYFFIVTSSVLVLISIIISLLLKFGPPRKIIKKSEILIIKNQITSLENDHNFNDALEKLFSIVKTKELITNISKESITANDVKENQAIYNLVKTLEEIKYTGKSIDQQLYSSIKDSVIKELV